MRLPGDERLTHVERATLALFTDPAEVQAALVRATHEQRLLKKLQGLSEQMRDEMASRIQKRQP